MKVCITGKGGVGKTTVAAILARTIARTADVVAVDADPNPNLAIALGLGVERAARIASVANVLIEEKLAHSHSHDEDHEHEEKDSEQLLAELSVVGPDGVRIVQTGKIERPSGGCLCCGSHRTTRRFLDELHAPGRVLVADLEAGVNDLMWAWPKHDDVVLVVTETYLKSIEVARRALQVARDLEVGRILVVANRVETQGDVDQVRRELPDVPVLVVPDDPAVTDASRRGLSPMDTAPGCPAVAAVARFVPALLDPDAPGDAVDVAAAAGSPTTA